jgi:hypothetical protein
LVKLRRAGLIAGWDLLEDVDLDDVQEAFQEHNWKKRPVNQEVLAYLAEQELDIVFTRIKLNPEFKTEDGRLWTSVNFTSVKGFRFKVLFPRHEEGKTTGLVSFYCQSEDAPPEEVVKGTVLTIIYFFKTSLQDVHWDRNKR